MYILLKHPNFLGDVLSIMRDYNCTNIRAIHAPKLNQEQAELIYNNFTGSPHYQRAVQSLVAPSHVFVIVFDLHPSTSIEDFKRTVQGTYGTTDTSTIRGHIAAALNNRDDGYVHVPDSEEKAIEDLPAFGEPMQVYG